MELLKPKRTREPTFLRDRYVTASGPVYPSDDIVLVGPLAGNITLDLPDAAGCRGRLLEFTKLGAAFTVTLRPHGTDTINGAATATLAAQWSHTALAACLVTPPNTYGWIAS